MTPRMIEISFYSNKRSASPVHVLVKAYPNNFSPYARQNSVAIRQELTRYLQEADKPECKFTEESDVLEKFGYK